MVVGFAADDAETGGSGVASICLKLQNEKKRHENRLRAISPTAARSLQIEKDFRKHVHGGESDSIRRVRIQKACDLEALLERTRLSADRLLQPESKNDCSCTGECSCDIGSTKSIDSVLEELERQVDLITEQPRTMDLKTKLELKLETAENTIEHLKSEGAFAHEEKKRALATVSALETTLAEKEQILENLAMKLSESQKDASQASELRESTTAASKEKGELLEKIVRLEASLHEQKQHVKSAKDLACHYEQRIKDLEHQMKLEEAENVQVGARAAEISAKKTEELNTLREIVDNVKLKETQLEGALKEAQRKLSDRAAQISDLDEVNRQKSVEIELLKSEVDNLRSAQEKDRNSSAPTSSLQTAALESKIRNEIEAKSALQSKELKQTVLKLQEENATLKERVHIVSAEQTKDLNTIQSLKKEVFDLNAKLEASKSTKGEVASQQSDKSDKRKALEASILVQRKKLSFLQTSGQPSAGVKACEEKLFQLEEELESSTTKLEHDIPKKNLPPSAETNSNNDSPRETSPLNTSKGADVSSVEDLKTALVTTEREKTELENEIIVRNKYSAEQAAKMMQLTDRIAELEASGKNLGDRESILDREVAELKNIISEKEGVLADTLASLEERQAEINSRDEALERARVELQALVAGQEQSETAISLEEMESLKKELSAKETEVCELQDANNELRTELESFRQDQGKSPEEDIAQLEMRVLEKEREISQLRDANEEMRAELGSHQRELDKVKESLEARLTKSNQQSARDAGAADSLRLEVVQFKLQLSEKEQVVSTLQQSNAEKQKEIEFLSNALESARADLESKKEDQEVLKQSIICNDETNTADREEDRSPDAVHECDPGSKAGLNGKPQDSLESARADVESKKEDQEVLKQSIICNDETNTADREEDRGPDAVHECDPGSTAGLNGKPQDAQMPGREEIDSGTDEDHLSTETDEKRGVAFSEAEVNELKVALEEAKKERLEAMQLSKKIESLQEDVLAKDNRLVEYEEKMNSLELFIDELQKQSQELELTVSNSNKAMLDIEAELEETIKNKRIFEERSHELDRLQVTLCEQEAELKKRDVEVDGLTAKLEKFATKTDAGKSSKYRWPSLVGRAAVGLILVGLAMTYQSTDQSPPIEVCNPKMTMAHKHKFANATVQTSPLPSIISKRSHLVLPLPPKIQKKQTTVDEPVFEIRPGVAQHTQTVLHRLLKTSPSSSYENTHGPPKYETFRFMKGFRKVAAKTFQSSVRTIRKVASHLDEIGVHNLLHESEFTNLDKAGDAVKGFLEQERRTVDKVRLAIEKVAHLELAQHIDPQPWDIGSRVAAAAVFEVSQFESPMLWGGIHPALWQDVGAPTSPPLKNLTVMSNHTSTE